MMNEGILTTPTLVGALPQLSARTRSTPTWIPSNGCWNASCNRTALYRGQAGYLQEPSEGYTGVAVWRMISPSNQSFTVSRHLV